MTKNCMKCNNGYICLVWHRLMTEFEECEAQITKTPEKKLCGVTALESAFNALASVCKCYIPHRPDTTRA